jgi:hypothetical protein
LLAVIPVSPTGALSPHPGPPRDFEGEGKGKARFETEKIGVEGSVEADVKCPSLQEASMGIVVGSETLAFVISSFILSVLVAASFP